MHKARITIYPHFTSGGKSSPNMIIHGENLATLARLKTGSTDAKGAMSFDIITIDPPYNVGGNQGYRNIWKGKSEKERDWAQDHGAFLDFMEPRLKIGRQLLTDEGIMFVNICDGEYCRLKILMDQIFGEGNCLGTIIWNKKQGSPGKHLTAIHEYVLIYAKNADKAPRLSRIKDGASLLIRKAHELKLANIPYEEAQKQFSTYIKELQDKQIITGSEGQYSHLHPATYKPFQAVSMSAQDNPEKRCHKPLIHPVTKKKCVVPDKGWRWNENTLTRRTSYNKNELFITQKFVIAGEIKYGKDESTIPRQVWYLENSMDHVMPSVITILHNQGKRDLPDGIDFATPKPVQLIKDLISSYPNKNARVLDYFAGSGTTGQAVIELNEEDGGSRSFVLIEEMGSTFNKVLLPRIRAIDPKRNYVVYETIVSLHSMLSD